VRILLDECVHAGVRAAFPGHSVETVAEVGWRSSKDGQLLELAVEGFDVFVTIDQNLEYQHNLKKVSIGFVIARVPNNKLDSYLPFSMNSRMPLKT
jgi:predicted nuclease of predicted toxin-antitoxin system